MSAERRVRRILRRVYTYMYWENSIYIALAFPIGHAYMCLHRIIASQWVWRELLQNRKGARTQAFMAKFGSQLTAIYIISTSIRTYNSSTPSSFNMGQRLQELCSARSFVLCRFMKGLAPFKTMENLHDDRTNRCLCTFGCPLPRQERVYFPKSKGTCMVQLSWQ